MRYPRTASATVCVSSQAGCGMNCPFCATGQAGLTRNLSTAEIVEQVVARARALAAGAVARRHRAGSATSSSWAWASRWPTTRRRSAPLRRLTDPRRTGLGCRHAASRSRRSGSSRPSTGWPARACPVTLALSLHAPDDELRDELVPVNTRWKVAEVLDAARRYFDATGRRVTIEYALIRDINDQAWRADLLGRAADRAGQGLGARQPDPAEPDAGLEVDRQRPGGRAGVRRTAPRPGDPDHGPRHPRPRDRRRLRPAGRRAASADGARRTGAAEDNSRGARAAGRARVLSGHGAGDRASRSWPSR